MHGCDAYRHGFRSALSYSSMTMLFLLFWFLSLTHAIPLDLTLDLNTFRNLTTTDRCANSPEWQAYAFLVEDCFTAIQRVYIEKVLKEPDETHEFISRGNYPRTEYPWLRTPAQYTVSESMPIPPNPAPFPKKEKRVPTDWETEDSCTLSIVMLDWFRPPWSLPGGGVEGSEPSDTTTFRTIWSAARIIERDCLLRTRRPGWGAIGKTRHPPPWTRIP